MQMDPKMAAVDKQVNDMAGSPMSNDDTAHGRPPPV